jgi:hypothetical protein
MRNLYTLILTVLVLSVQANAQNISGQVLDETGKPLAFATIKYGGYKSGMVADIEGKFSFRYAEQIKFIEVSYLNFQTQRVDIKNDTAFLRITLLPSNTSGETVIVYSNNKKLKRILNTVSAKREDNNPDRYEKYQCLVYYKLTADLQLDSGFSKKDSTRSKKPKWDFEGQHVFMTETYSKRSWARPQKLQEEVIATKMSGLKKSIFSSFVTDVVPFHAYRDYININGKDFFNPIAPGLFQRFKFKMLDEIFQGRDTLWLIAFEPIRNPNELRGTLFIHSKGYAIQNISAHAIDSILKKDIAIEQEYSLVNDKWFPKQLNYTLFTPLPFQGNSIIMKGISIIDSVQYELPHDFKFDKAHTVILQPNADERTDSSWNTFRPLSQDEKDERTYIYMDSLYRAIGLQQLASIGGKLNEAKIPVGIFDVNIDRIYSRNSYEGSRWGLGLQTNEKLWKHLSIGGWGGYGTLDKKWKYGVFAEYYVDPPRREFVFSLYYYDNLRAAGKLQLQTGTDFSAFRQLQVNTLDHVKGLNFTMQKKFGYLSSALSVIKEDFKPTYNYIYTYAGKSSAAFTNREIAVNLRYAFGERTAPSFGRYFISANSRYPVLYARINSGDINEDFKYTQATLGISWTRHINRFGKENLLLLGGRSFSEKPLPIQKLYAGNAFTNGAYTFGVMQTMPAGQFYSDKFVNFFWLHSFDFNFWNKTNKKKKLSTAPYLSLGYNMQWGSMKNPEVHQNIIFSTPEPAYHEAGAMINNILRAKVLNMGYISLNAGYFQHLTDQTTKRNQKYILGLSVDL